MIGALRAVGLVLLACFSLAGCSLASLTVTVEDPGPPAEFLILGGRDPEEVRRIEFRDADGQAVWVIEATEPVRLRDVDLRVVYAQTPDGFRQSVPEDGSAPPSLTASPRAALVVYGDQYLLALPLKAAGGGRIAADPRPPNDRTYLR